MSAEEIGPTDSIPSRSGWNPAVMENAANYGAGRAKETGVAPASRPGGRSLG